MQPMRTSSCADRDSAGRAGQVTARRPSLRTAPPPRRGEGTIAGPVDWAGTGPVRRCATVSNDAEGRSGTVDFVDACAWSRTVRKPPRGHGIQEVEGPTPFGSTPAPLILLVPGLVLGRFGFRGPGRP